MSHLSDPVKRYMPTGGDHLIWCLVHVCGIPTAEIARRVGVTRPIINKYLLGTSRPRKPTQMLIGDVIREEIEHLKTVERKALQQAQHLQAYNIAVRRMLTETLKRYERN